MDVHIIGAGGNCKIIIDICELLKYNIIGIFDDKFIGEETIVYNKFHLIGKISHITSYKSINIINSIGDNATRKKIFDLYPNLNWINLIHPTSYISPSVTFGKGNIICHLSVINSDSTIGNFNLINTSAIIEHDCIIGDYNHFAPRSTLYGGVRIGNLNLIGASITIIPSKKIQNNCIVGAGSVVTTDFSSDVTVIGIPARIFSRSNI